MKRKKKSSIYSSSAEQKLPKTVLTDMGAKSKVNFKVAKLKNKGHTFGKTILRI
jgi:hypothetical protein